MADLRDEFFILQDDRSRLANELDRRSRLAPKELELSRQCRGHVPGWTRAGVTIVEEPPWPPPIRTGPGRMVPVLRARPSTRPAPSPRTRTRRDAPDLRHDRRTDFTAWPAAKARRPISKDVCGQRLDAKIGGAQVRVFGEIGDQRVTVMAALTVADDLSAAERRIETLQARIEGLEQRERDADARLETVYGSVAEAIGGAAGRIERIARSLDALPRE